MPRRLIIGLTGGIASGKTAVAQRFQELGVAVIDADESSRWVVAPGQPGLSAVTTRFGTDILTAAGELDRSALRDRIFADPQERLALEAILHPLIRANMEQRAAAAPGKYVILVIPLLVEGGNARARVDRILVVDASEKTQLERMIARDGCSLNQARAILCAQADRDTRLQAADDVLVNSGTIAELRQGVDILHGRYLSLAAEMAADPGHLAQIQGLP
jgi:dephospho-CoA kinase